ncbi:MAG: aminodeoxychorismate synthase component I [Gammaproteobacteria bacterium]
MTQPRIAELDYVADTPRCFSAFAHAPWCALLDSGRPDSRQGRFDIFSAEPYATLTVRGEVTEITTRDRVELSHRQPLELLKRQLGEPTPSVAGLPFAGGAIGYFGYDLGRRFERLPHLAQRDIDLPDMAMGLYDWAVVVDHLRERAWLVGQGRDERTLDEWPELLEKVSGQPPNPAAQPFEVLSPVTSNFDRDSYGQAFRRIQEHIRAGDCYQVNLTQRFAARVQGDSWQAYERLREINPAPFSAFLSTPSGDLLSSSPERFLSVRGSDVETRPIKGTRSRSVSKRKDAELANELRASAKDRAENVMIVDLLRNDLGKNCVPGSIVVNSLFEIESFANVHHLVSTVSGRLAADRHALDLLQGCFPGGSITGAPKVRAMEIIESLEPHRRSVYCGSIGYIGFDGNMDCNIAIRTLLRQGDQIHAWAGGGVVADSEVEAEYRESLDKAALLLELMTSGVPKVGASGRR